MPTIKNKFEIIIRPGSRIKSRQWLKNILEKTRKVLSEITRAKKTKSYKNFSCTLLVTNNKEVKKLNNKFRKINKPTDVLSFHLSKKEQVKNKYLGDIVISAESAERQALNLNKEIDDELKTLLVHGYLHLNGYDHMTKKEAKVMFLLQKKILEKL